MMNTTLGNPYASAYAAQMSLLAAPSTMPVNSYGYGWQTPMVNGMNGMNGMLGAFPTGTGATVIPGMMPQMNGQNVLPPIQGPFAVQNWLGGFLPNQATVITDPSRTAPVGTSTTSSIPATTQASSPLGTTILPTTLGGLTNPSNPNIPFWQDNILNWNQQQLGINPMAASSTAAAAGYKKQFEVAKEWAPRATLAGLGVGAGLTWMAGTALLGGVALPLIALGGLAGAGLGLVTANSLAPEWIGKAARDESLSQQFYSNNGMMNGGPQAKQIWTRNRDEAQMELSAANA